MKTMNYKWKTKWMASLPAGRSRSPRWTSGRCRCRTFITRRLKWCVTKARLCGRLPRPRRGCTTWSRLAVRPGIGIRLWTSWMWIILRWCSILVNSVRIEIDYRLLPHRIRLGIGRRIRLFNQHADFRKIRISTKTWG